MHLPQLNCCLGVEETTGSGCGDGDGTVSGSVGLLCILGDFLFKFGLEFCCVMRSGSGGGGGGIETDSGSVGLLCNLADLLFKFGLLTCEECVFSGGVSD